MSLLATVPDAILKTILTGLANLFLAGANGDTAAARHAASHMLAVYQPETEDEIRLAANIIGFSFRTIETLGQAAAPDIPQTSSIRLCAIAVSLSREAAKAERRLSQLQKSRRPPVPARKSPTWKEIAETVLSGTAPTESPEAETAEPEPKFEQSLVQKIGKVAEAARAGGISWTQAYNDRQRDLRVAASIKRAMDRTGAPSVEKENVEATLPSNPQIEHHTA